MHRESTVFPFTAVVGQEQIKRALLLNAVGHEVGGVLVRGRRGTAKSTLARGLADLLPEIDVVPDCPFSCDPGDTGTLCPCCAKRLALEGSLPEARTRMRFVTLPLNATEEMVAGTLDIEKALRHGEKNFVPGVLARANRSILYVDEVNLLEDHIVDILLDSAAMGVNIVERESISFRHGSRFILIGTMNPEEGDLRPQLEDRFGLCAEADTGVSAEDRVRIIRRNLQFGRNPVEFEMRWSGAQEDLRRRILAARGLYPAVETPEAALETAAEIVHRAGADGHRAEISMVQGARALAALEGCDRVQTGHVLNVAPLALNHRLRRSPLGFEDGERPDVRTLLSGLEPSRLFPSAGFPGGGAASEDPDTTSHPDLGAVKPEAGEGPPGAYRSPAVPLRRDEQDTIGQAAAGGLPPGSGPGPAVGSWPSPDAPASGDPRAGRAEIAAARETPEKDRPAAGGDLVIPDRDTQGVSRGRRRPAGGNAERGRYYGSTSPANLKRPFSTRDIAVDATIRAAAARGQGDDGNRAVLPEDLRAKLRSARFGASIVFVVDASASMGAQKRLDASRQAILSLLVEAYQKRDRVGLVVFKDDSARVAMSPTSSPALASRLLARLAPGGATPLPHGLALGYQVLERELSYNPQMKPVLVLISDGGGNVTIGDADFSDPMRESLGIARKIRDRGIRSVVIDSAPEGQSRTAPRNGISPARRIAHAMGGAYFPVPELTADAIKEKVERSTSQTGLAHRAC